MPDSQARADEQRQQQAGAKRDLELHTTAHAWKQDRAVENVCNYKGHYTISMRKLATSHHFDLKLDVLLLNCQADFKSRLQLLGEVAVAESFHAISRCPSHSPWMVCTMLALLLMTIDDPWW